MAENPEKKAILAIANFLLIYSLFAFWHKILPWPLGTLELNLSYKIR